MKAKPIDLEALAAQRRADRLSRKLYNRARYVRQYTRRQKT